MSGLSTLVRRLKKINIDLEIVSNYPWIYLERVNKKKVSDKFLSEHFFTIAFHPKEPGQEAKLTDLTKIFETIRKCV